MKIATDDYQENIISLCPVESNHKEVLLQLFRECRPDLELMGNIDEKQKDAIIFQQFTIEQDQLRKMYPNAEFNIVMFNEEPIGRFYIYYGEEFHHIIEIGLLESYRGLGIGKAIMSAAISNAVQKGKKIYLQVAWFNQNAYLFYEKLGFRVIEDNIAFKKMQYMA